MKKKKEKESGGVFGVCFFFVWVWVFVGLVFPTPPEQFHFLVICTTELIYELECRVVSSVDLL